MPLATRYEYDDWGQQRCEIGPEVKGLRSMTSIGPTLGVKAPKVTYPPRPQLERVCRWHVEPGQDHHLVEPVRAACPGTAFDLAGERYAKHEYFYDGLGRNVRKSMQATLPAPAMTLSAAWLTRRWLTNLWCTAIMPCTAATTPLTLISVNGIELGRQVFDGLNRMITSITGALALITISLARPSRAG